MRNIPPNMLDKDNMYLESIGMGAQKLKQEIYIPDEDFDMDEFK